MAVETEQNGSLKQIDINEKKKFGTKYVGIKYTEIRVNERLQHECQAWILPLSIFLTFHKHHLSVEFAIYKVGFSFSVHKVSNV